MLEPERYYSGLTAKLRRKSRRRLNCVIHVIIMLLMIAYEAMTSHSTLVSSSSDRSDAVCCIVNRSHIKHMQSSRAVHIMPISPPIMLCSSAPSLFYYSFPTMLILCSPFRPL